MQNPKSLLRKKVLEQRDSLEKIQVEENSAKIVKTLMSTQEFKNSRFIMCYMSFRNEVSTIRLIEECMALGKRVAIPLVEAAAGAKKDITPCEIKNIKTELREGTYGILEPDKNSVRRISEDEVDLVIVPGVAFDRQKQRIGFGAGYYDRFLSKVRRDCKKVAVAFEIQLVDKIPSEAHDIPMDIIITEKRIIR